MSLPNTALLIHLDVLTVKDAVISLQDKFGSLQILVLVVILKLLLFQHG